MTSARKYTPRTVPPPGPLYPLGKLRRLEFNLDGEHSEAEFDYRSRLKAPWVFWSKKQEAIYVVIGPIRVLNSEPGHKAHERAAAREFERWMRAPQTERHDVELPDLCRLECMGSLISIHYYSNKWTPKDWKRYGHRPYGHMDPGDAFQSKNMVSVGPTFENPDYIFVKGPRMRATTDGLIN